MAQPYQAIIVVSFGGPEGPDDVMPFLETVTKGRNIPRERLLEVAEHYLMFGGVSPINQQNRQLIAALKQELDEAQLKLPIYWGNRNWHPFLADTVRQMADDGIQQALAFVTSAFGSYSGCRQYLENIEQARQTVGPRAPQIDKIRGFFNHRGFILPMIDRTRTALEQIPADRRSAARLVFTAHSITVSMEQTSHYEQQLAEACRLVASGVEHDDWKLVYQSRSGPPSQPWLEPDVCDYLRSLHEQNVQDVVLVPIGFISDHMEVLFDLDTEAQELAHSCGMNLVRAGTVGVHPQFIQMIAELIVERLDETLPSSPLGQLPACSHLCPSTCCPAPVRPPR